MVITRWEWSRGGVNGPNLQISTDDGTSAVIYFTAGSGADLLERLNDKRIKLMEEVVEAAKWEVWGHAGSEYERRVRLESALNRLLEEEGKGKVKGAESE